MRLDLNSHGYRMQVGVFHPHPTFLKNSDLFMCETWLLCATWLVHTSDITHSYRACDLGLSLVFEKHIHDDSCVRHDSYKLGSFTRIQHFHPHPTFLRHFTRNSQVTWWNFKSLFHIDILHVTRRSKWTSGKFSRVPYTSWGLSNCWMRVRILQSEPATGLLCEVTIERTCEYDTG